MKINDSDINIHITGYHPAREITKEEAIERGEPRKLVGFQCGFEPFIIAVYGNGLNDADCEEAAIEYLDKKGWFAGREKEADWII
jgi:hypothetical protein